MHYLAEVKKWLGEIMEVFLLLIALGVLVEILFGTINIPFFEGVTANLTTLIGKLGDGGLVGLIALGIIIYLFQRGKVFAGQHQHQQ
jgi:hypothetical protein